MIPRSPVTLRPSPPINLSAQALARSAGISQKAHAAELYAGRGRQRAAEIEVFAATGEKSCLQVQERKNERELGYSRPGRRESGRAAGWSGWLSAAAGVATRPCRPASRRPCTRASCWPCCCACPCTFATRAWNFTETERKRPALRISFLRLRPPFFFPPFLRARLRPVAFIAGLLGLCGLILGLLLDSSGDYDRNTEDQLTMREMIFRFIM